MTSKTRKREILGFKWNGGRPRRRERAWPAPSLFEGGRGWFASRNRGRDPGVQEGKILQFTQVQHFSRSFWPYRSGLAISGTNSSTASGGFSWSPPTPPVGTAPKLS